MTEGPVPPSSVGDQHHLLLFVAAVLRGAGADFPGNELSALLRDLMDADFAGAGEVDFRGTASRRWADAPGPVLLGATGFHDLVTAHPLTAVYRRSPRETPVRLSDLMNPRKKGPFPGSGKSDVLIVPLAAGAWGVKVLTLMRRDFDPRQLRLARQLQPVLAQIHGLTWRLRSLPEKARAGEAPFGDEGIALTAGELRVLDLMADGLIAAAIARRLGVSPRTVSKHIESIYRKFGSHDRTSAVLRGFALGLLPASQPR
ncbi:response regulator transcription factor [Nonomuraea sp. AD125B]|uniref:response regulator transcription factor n=1 Tax=Nonomuraea TaxID=83681 RepID=UPI0031DA3120